MTVHQYIYVMIRSLILHTNQYSILHFCSCVAIHCIQLAAYSYYMIFYKAVVWVPCEIWGESCKLLARFTFINFKAFLNCKHILQLLQPDPLELLIAITNCTLHEPSKFHAVSPVHQVYNYLYIYSIESLKNLQT